MPLCKSLSGDCQSRMGIEIMMETSTRSARNRRVVAIMGWGVLVGTALILWNGRLQDSIRSVGDEPVAFVLAAFSAFVGVFAWLLFNPGRRAASESPVLFFAAAATLFPPPIIGFCLMPVDSPLRGWLAFVLFLLCVIAVLSHVPDDFFGVPRGRSSYMTPIPTFDAVDDAIMSPEAAWFTFEDLTRILPDAERPSLAPKSYLQQEVTRPAAVAVRGQDKVASEVDDILGSDFDLGLLDEDLTDFDRTTPRRESTLKTAFDRPQKIIDRQQTQTDQTVTKTEVRSESKNRSQSQQASSSVFESFENSAKPKRSDSADRYRAASKTSGTSVRLKQRFQTEGKSSFGLPAAAKANSATADSIRRQLEGKSRVTVSGQSGSGIASASRQTLADQAADSLLSRTRQKSSDSEIEYGTLDVHTGQQPNKARQEVRRSETSGTSRQQDQRRKGRQQDVTAQQQDNASSTSRSDRVSRFEQREQASNRPADDRTAGRSEPSDDTSRTADRKLVRQTASREAAEELAAETKPKRRSALDIATAGILGAGAAAGLTKSDSATAEEATDPTGPDLDAAASSGLFGTVRDLFQKPKKSSTDDTTGAEEFDSAVDSVQSRRQSNEDVAIERTIDASGAEMVEGVAVVRFERGQKKANIHIPFSPPMKGQPEVEVECVGDEQLRLKVPMAEPYGMRIEARRSNTSEALEAEIGFAAMAEEE